MDGQWVEDPKARRGWRWDAAAPAGDPSPTSMLPARGPAAPPSVARYGADDDPQGPPLPPLDHEQPPDPAGIVVCERCGSAVSPDRLR